MPRTLRNWTRGSPRPASDIRGGRDAVDGAMKSGKLLARLLVGLLLGAALLGAGGTTCGDATRVPATTAPSPIVTPPTPSTTPSPAPSATGADGAPFTLSGTGSATRDVALVEGRWTLIGRAFFEPDSAAKPGCQREPCPSLKLTVEVDDGDPPRHDQYNPRLWDPYPALTVDLPYGATAVYESSHILLWVGRLGFVKSGTQRIIVTAQSAVRWELVFEDYDGPFLPPDPAGARGESFTLSGTGPAFREIRLAEGTWSVTVDVSKNSYDCEHPEDRCAPAALAVEIEALDGSSSSVGFHETASHWTRTYDNLRVADGREWHYPTGPLVVEVDVVPRAQWTVTFVAPGAPMPSPTPTLTPTPTLGPDPSAYVPRTVAEIQADLPCLTAEEAEYLHALLVQVAKAQEPSNALIELVMAARADPNVVRTEDYQRDLSRHMAAWRSVLRQVSDIAPPTSSRGQEVYAVMVAAVDSSLAVLDYSETSAAVGDFGRPEATARVLVPYVTDLQLLGRVIIELCV